MTKIEVQAKTEEQIKEIARGLINGKYRLPDESVGMDKLLLATLAKDHKPTDFEGLTFLIDCTDSVLSVNGKAAGLNGLLIRTTDFNKAIDFVKLLS